MNWLDIAIIVLILIPTFMGLKAGLIKTVLTLAGVILGIFLAGRYHGVLAEQLPQLILPDRFQYFTVRDTHLVVLGDKDSFRSILEYRPVFLFARD